jgi:hypothetical protein
MTIDEAEKELSELRIKLAKAARQRDQLMSAMRMVSVMARQGEAIGYIAGYAERALRNVESG